MALVGVICQFVEKRHPDLHPSLFIKDDGEAANIPLQMGDGYRPDFIYEWGNVLIIGEAKTPFDIERPHSISQYRSYLKYCERFEGQATFILSTNWDYEATARGLLKRLYREMGATKTHIEVISMMTLLMVKNATN